MIPNVSSFVQSVFSLMRSSNVVVVQCEAAALLTELTTAPEVLEAVEKCYTKIVSLNDIDEDLRKIITGRLKTVREKRASIQKKQRQKAPKIIEL